MLAVERVNRFKPQGAGLEVVQGQGSVNAYAVTLRRTMRRMRAPEQRIEDPQTGLAEAHQGRMEKGSKLRFVELFGR